VILFILPYKNEFSYHYAYRVVYLLVAVSFAYLLLDELGDLIHDPLPEGPLAVTLPVLRGFSRNVKQDSEASNASGGVSNANVSAWHSTVSGMMSLCCHNSN
jgi:hypothetical protein